MSEGFAADLTAETGGRQTGVRGQMSQYKARTIWWGEKVKQNLELDLCYKVNAFRSF